MKKSKIKKLVLTNGQCMRILNYSNEKFYNLMFDCLEQKNPNDYQLEDIKTAVEKANEYLGQLPIHHHKTSAESFLAEDGGENEFRPITPRQSDRAIAVIGQIMQGDFLHAFYEFLCCVDDYGRKKDHPKMSFNEYTLYKCVITCFKAKLNDC